MITFARRIIHREDDDRLPPGGKRAQAGCDLVAKAALVRRLRQVGSRRFDFGPPTRADLRSGEVDDPAQDGIEVIRDGRMEPDAVAHASRAA